MRHSGSTTPSSARPELDLVELRRARLLRDRYAASAGRPERRPARHSWLRRSLLLVAVSCLGIYAYAAAERMWADHRSRAWLESEPAQPTISASAQDIVPAETEPADQHHTPPPTWPEPTIGDPLGRLTIPDLDVEGAVEHGNTSSVLRRAIGHLPGTALPGRGGHVVLAGHRDSFFRGLRHVTRGQQITLSTPAGDFVYQVDGLRIVGPRDVDVIAPTPEERLTLVTCFPFDYVGPAPRRFIVTAHPVNPKGRTATVSDHS